MQLRASDPNLVSAEAENQVSENKQSSLFIEKPRALQNSN